MADTSLPTAEATLLNEEPWPLLTDDEFANIRRANAECVQPSQSITRVCQLAVSLKSALEKAEAENATLREHTLKTEHDFIEACREVTSLTIERDRLKAALKELFPGPRMEPAGDDPSAMVQVDANAYYNLGGAIVDIERQIFTDGYYCDAVCLRTLKRVEMQLGRASQAITGGDETTASSGHEGAPEGA